MSDLVPYLEEGVPGSSADRHTVLGDAQTGNSVVVSSQYTWIIIIIIIIIIIVLIIINIFTCTLSPESIPDVAVEVVVAGEEEPAGLAERDAGDAADDVVVAVDCQLLVTSYVEHPTGGVITASSKSEAIGEKLENKVLSENWGGPGPDVLSTHHNRVNIAFMSSKCLQAISTSNIPELETYNYYL